MQFIRAYDNGKCVYVRYFWVKCSLYGLVRKRRGQIDEYYNEALHCQKKVDERDDRVRIANMPKLFTEHPFTKSFCALTVQIASLEEKIEVLKKKVEEIPSSEQVKAERKNIREKTRKATSKEDEAALERQQVIRFPRYLEQIRKLNSLSNMRAGRRENGRIE